MHHATHHTETEVQRSEFDFDEAVDLCGLSRLQRDFAKAILRGANRTQAARVAGYSGTDEQLRGAGYKAYNSPKVQSSSLWQSRKGVAFLMSQETLRS